MAKADRSPMPRGVELAWSRSHGNKPGPRPGLSLKQIINAAIEIADEAGLAAVSLARVAVNLGCATTSLYRHIRSKDDLVVLMCDAAAAPPPDLPAPDPQQWQKSLCDLAWQMFDLYRAHPWSLEAPPSGPPTTPNQLLWGEHMLRAMSHTTLTYPEQLRAITLVAGYAREQARLATDPVITNDVAPPTGPQSYFQLLSTVMTPDRYPMFCRIFADDNITASISYTHEDFQFGLDRIMAGLTELHERRTTER
ncbi:TetR/AcrR family transcriptional regulator [Crossiella sp. NPDC003009]